MRLSKPRIPPVELDRMTPEQEASLAGRGGFAGQAEPLAVLRTIAQAPRTLKRYLGWSDYILGPHSDLKPRLRELVILRTGWLCRSGYEWSQHAVVGRDVGLGEEEIARVKRGAAASGWSALEAAALLATDQLVGDQFIDEPTWQALAPLGDKGRMDLVFTCGQYVMVAMLLNSLGVQLEAGQPIDPDLQGPEPDDDGRGP